MRTTSITFSLLLLFLPALASAHCDTVNGPVVAAGQQALATGDLTPALHWIKPQYEPELRNTFNAVLAVRANAKDVGDRLFLETLVRLHRAGEGAPFEGIKPAGTDVTPAITAADEAVEKGDPAVLQKLLAKTQAEGLAARYSETMEAKKHANESVAAGRAYVAAYTELVHYVEGVEAALNAKGH